MICLFVFIFKYILGPHILLLLCDPPLWVIVILRVVGDRVKKEDLESKTRQPFAKARIEARVARRNSSFT